MKSMKITTRNILLIICSLAMGTTVNAQSFEWVKGIGGNGINDNEASEGVAIDRGGNVYSVGYSRSDTLDFNRGGNARKVTTNAENNNIYLTKYDPSGRYLWAIIVGGDGSDWGYGVAVDKSNNVYITGYFQSDTADFNPYSNNGALINKGRANVFLAKYDSSGQYLWAKSIGGDGYDYAYGVATDTNGHVYITGRTKSDTIDFNRGGTGGKLTSVGGGYDAFIAKYDAGGNYLWAKRIGGTGNDYGYSVAVDNHNNDVYITGCFNSPTADVNPGGTGGTLNNILIGYDIFIAKYEAGGKYLWAKNMGGDGSEYGRSIAVSDSGNVYVTGYFGSDTADFNPGGSGGLLLNVGNWDVFLAKYDTKGNYLWAKGMGGDEQDYSYGIAVDNNGSAYITGYSMSDTIDLNPTGNGGVFTNMGSFDVFTAKYDTKGNFSWAKTMGGAKSDQGLGVAVDNNGNTYVAGQFFSDTADFNLGGSGGVIAKGGGFDGFVVKLGCSDTIFSHLQDTLPCGEAYTLNDSIYTKSGTYTQLIPNPSGCDSMVTLDLTIIPIPQPVININHFTLGVAGSYPYTTYQWIKDGSAIPGATDSTYTVTVNGDYQVAVSNDKGCTDTSDIYSITNAGIADGQDLAEQVQIYPNPTEDKVFIQSPVPVTATLTDITGKTIRELPAAQSIPLDDLADGIYLLRISNPKGMLIKVVKVVKQEP